MVINKGFSLKLCSDLSYEGMVVDLDFNGQQVATANYDKGVDNIEITILPFIEKNEKKEFSLDEFISALKKMKRLLEKCAEEDEERKKC